jgi:predicted peptidase
MAQPGEPIKIEPGRQLPQSATVRETSGNGERDLTMYYMLFAPKNYHDDGEPWPLMLFLHGYGECGDNELERVKIHGPAKLVDSRADFPFVVVTPQCPRPEPNMEEIRRAWRPNQLMQLIDHVSENMNIDRTRLYVTGLSMGGYGTWRLVAAYPERFAAAVPICGGGEPANMAKALSRVPVWAFHGALDETVPLTQSQEMVDAVREAGGDVKFTVYPDVGHNSWKPAYEDQKIYDWLLSKRLATE